MLIKNYGPNGKLNEKVFCETLENFTNFNPGEWSDSDLAYYAALIAQGERKAKKALINRVGKTLASLTDFRGLGSLSMDDLRIIMEKLVDVKRVLNGEPPFIRA